MGIASRHVQASPLVPEQSPRSERLRMLDLENLAACVHLSSGASNSTLCPDARRPQRDGYYSCSTKRGARLWSSYQIRGNLVDPKRASPTWVDAEAKVYGVALRRGDRCARPLCFAPYTVSAHYELWGTIPYRRVAVKRPISPLGAQVDSRAGCRRGRCGYESSSSDEASKLQKLANE